MPLKNHHEGIPGGYSFYQPETNWTAPPWLGWTQLRDAIITHRMANPRFNLSTNPGVVEAEMDHFNTLKLMAMPGTQHFLLPGDGDTASPPNFPVPRRLAEGVAAGLKRTAVGIGTVIELFGPSAEPVAPSLSEKRAQICAGCPKNERGNLLQRFKAEVVAGIQKTLGIVKDMDLKTSVDAKLGTCLACTCPTAFKVHVSLETILKNTTSETMSKFNQSNPECWILTESKATA